MNKTAAVKKVRTLVQAVIDPRVRSFSDERDAYTNDGIWLYLNYPWWCPDTDLPHVHEFTVRDLCRSLNSCYEDPERWNA